MYDFNKLRKYLDDNNIDLKDLALNNFPFKTFRKGQLDAIIEILKVFIYKGKKHVFLDASTGSGKSAIAYTVAKCLYAVDNSFRSTITTRTKSLQDQYCTSFSSIYDLKSKMNYPCKLMRNEYYDNMFCKIQKRKKRCNPKTDCVYYKRRCTWSLLSRIRSTNHSFILECCSLVCSNEDNRSNLIVIDEAHNICDSIIEHSKIELDIDNIEEVLTLLSKRVKIDYTNILHYISQIISCIPPDLKIYKITPEFRDLSSALLNVVSGLYSQINKYVEDLLNVEGEKAVEKVSPLLDEFSNIKELCEILTLCELKSEFFVVEHNGNKIVLKPVLPRYTAQFRLFRKSDVFLYMSSTLCDTDSLAYMLGVDLKDCHTINMENNFDVKNRKVYYIPKAKVTSYNANNAIKTITEFTDKIITHHFQKSEFKGIVHTVSYKNAELFKQYSKYGGIIVIPENPREAVDTLKASHKCILATPSMEEGYDLVDDLSRFQILIKVPYGYLGDPLINYIAETYPIIYARNTVSRIVQASGRSVRSEKDFASTYILDSSFGTLLSKYEKLFPKWYIDSIHFQK